MIITTPGPGGDGYSIASGWQKTNEEVGSERGSELMEMFFQTLRPNFQLIDTTRSLPIVLKAFFSYVHKGTTALPKYKIK
jgi:hypothetical protein